MTHAYTPGLRVTEKTKIIKKRILPLKGDVVVAKGDKVTPDTVVARTEIPGPVEPVNVANILGVPPEDVNDAMLKKVGDKVEEGEIIAKNEKQVVIKVGDEFKTIERSKIKSIDKKKKEEDSSIDSDEDSSKEEKPELGRGAEDKKKKAEEEEKKNAKDLAGVKLLYKKWMRNRKELVCKPCKGTGQINCKLCKGVGWYRSASVGGGLGRVKCHDCMWKGKYDCKKCKKKGAKKAF